MTLDSFKAQIAIKFNKCINIWKNVQKMTLFRELQNQVKKLIKFFKTLKISLIIT